eukprot:TRINITY_DN55567_c0_g1_i1.p1 TRINITY_DN55567_c0_g1~~TRINITY_DN55567_c0_g1_i1.p1  ORF type:complete len:302 (+),score=53.57 TRINITY_DN55567_c0_g1_i1:191-1096(+)
MSRDFVAAWSFFTLATWALEAPRALFPLENHGSSVGSLGVISSDDVAAELGGIARVANADVGARVGGKSLLVRREAVSTSRVPLGRDADVEMIPLTTDEVPAPPHIDEGVAWREYNRGVPTVPPLEKREIAPEEEPEENASQLIYAGSKDQKPYFVDDGATQVKREEQDFVRIGAGYCRDSHAFGDDLRNRQVSHTHSPRQCMQECAKATGCIGVAVDFRFCWVYGVADELDGFRQFPDGVPPPPKIFLAGDGKDPSVSCYAYRGVVPTPAPTKPLVNEFEVDVNGSFFDRYRVPKRPPKG